MTGFMGQCAQAVAPSNSNTHLGIAMKYFGDTDDIYNELTLNKRDDLPSCGWASFNQAKALRTNRGFLEMRRLCLKAAASAPALCTLDLQGHEPGPCVFSRGRLHPGAAGHQPTSSPDHTPVQTRFAGDV